MLLYNSMRFCSVGKFIIENVIGEFYDIPRWDLFNIEKRKENYVIVGFCRRIGGF